MRAITAALVLAAAGTAWAQDPNRQNRGMDFILNRMKEQLGLSEEQLAKVKEIFTKDGEDRTKLDEARTAKVNELLNEEQKTKYAEMQNRLRQFGQGGGGQGGQGFRGFGGGQGLGGALQGQQMTIEDLKRELSLTDEQVEKIRPVTEEFAESMRKRFEELRQNGFQGLNFQDEMRKFQDSIKEIGDKVKAHLNDDQKKKYDELVESRMAGFRQIQGMLGGALGGLGGGAARQAPRASVEERVRRAMEALKIENEQERRAIADLVRKVVEALHDLEDYGKTSRETLGDAAKNKDLGDPAIEDRLKSHLEERKNKEKTLAQLQKELADVVTNRQELELIAQGILR